MPTSSPKPCCVCRALVADGTERCPEHKREAWAKPAAGGGTKRRTGRALQRDRAALFAREPLCRTCQQQGRVALAVIRDHVKPLGEGGPDTDANVQPLCQVCSDAKTEAEKARGLARWVPGRRGGGSNLGSPPPETVLSGSFLRE